MIRINLLSEGRKPIAAKKSALSGISLGGVDTGSLALVGLLLAGLLTVFGHNFLVGRQVDAKQAEVAEAQREVERLAPIIKEVEDFKTKKAELQQKVAVINELRANQRGPVQIMDKISRALPELLWLTKMEARGNLIALSGEAYNTNAVALFIENLDRVSEFQEPVTRDVSRRRGTAYNFVVEFTFTHTPKAGSVDGLGDADGGAVAATAS